MDEMRDDLNAAIDELEPETGTDASGTTTADVVQAATEPDITPSVSAKDSATDGDAEGSEIPKDTGTGADSGLAEGETNAATQSADDPSNSPTPETITAKAPVDWNAQQREVWSKVPPEIQQKITAREAEMSQAMQGTAQARQTHDQLSQLATAYAPVLAAEGVDSPMQAVEGLFKTVASLRMGTEAQKANAVATIIQNYGIDIGALDNVLSGQQATADPQAQHLEQLLEQRMAPVNQLLSQINNAQNQSTQRTQSEAESAVSAFEQQAEFLSDVRLDMADLMDLAAKNGRQYTLQEAYDRACALHPEVSKVVAQRESVAALQGNQSQMNARRNAASSLPRGQAGGAGAGESLSLHDSISAAWDGQSE